MIFDIFYTDKFDKTPILKYKDKIYNGEEIKNLVFANLHKKSEIFIKTENNFFFVIRFLAGIFSKSKIYLGEGQEEEILPPCPSYGVFEEIDYDKAEIFLKTSGSSGNPKCVQKNLTNLINEAKDLKLETGFDTKNLTVVLSNPMHHMFGLTFGFFYPLVNGIFLDTNKVNYPDKLNFKDILFVSSPSFLDSFRKYSITPDIPPKYVVTAGSKLDFDTFSYLENLKINVLEIYGSTETGIIAKRCTAKAPLTLFKNVEVEPMADGAFISSPYVFEGCIKVNDNIKTEGRNLTILNRTDRVLKIYDKRIKAPEIEEKLKENEFVQDAYCLEVEGKIGCILELTPCGIDFLIKNGVVELNKYLKSYLGEFFEIVPQRWRYTDIIPKTETGKYDREEILKLFLQNLSIPVILSRKITENEGIFELFFYKNCNFYNGHFPNYPITPGVVQLHFASYFANIAFNKKFIAGQIKKIKFSNIINADEIVKLKLKKEKNGLYFEYFNENKVFSSGILPDFNIFEVKNEV